MSEKEIRLNKYLSDCGICSRREADRLIEAGRITVDGRTARTGQKILPGQDIKLDENPVEKKNREILLAFYKPRGIVCTEEKREKNNIIDYLNYPCRVFTVGRLDKDSEGLLLLTNLGEVANQIMRSRNGHEKEYLVTINKEVTEDFLRQMTSGVPILDTVTRPCRAKRTGKNSFRIVLTQGLNRQIRRMCEALGYKVTKLLRVRVLNVELGSLKSGEIRRLTKQELKEIYEQTKGRQDEGAYGAS